MSASKVAIDRFIERALKVPLKELGFRQAARNFRRHAGQGVQVLNVQASRHNFGGTADFTVNLGVYFSRVAEFLGEIPLRQPMEYQCQVRERLGQLANLRDEWWTVKLLSDMTSVVNEVRSCVQSIGIPFLDMNSTIEAASNSPQLRGSIWERVAIQCLAGHKDRVLAMMRTDLATSNLRRVEWKIHAERCGFGEEYATITSKVGSNEPGTDVSG